MNRGRCVFLWPPVMLVAFLVVAASTANASLPSGATQVGVNGGNTTSGIDGHVHPAGSISGTIRSVAGIQPLSGTQVFAYLGGKFVSSGLTNGSGQYQISGLGPTATGYVICVDGRFTTGGGSTSGYLGRCYKTAFWGGSGSTIPAGATKVPLTSGQQKTGIDLNMPSGAAITGTVTGGGTGLNSVQVTAYNRSNGLTYHGFTASGGGYSIKGLAASAKGYTVCFNPGFGSQGATGFRPLCFRNTPWNGGSAYPSTATPVSVTLGGTRGGVSSSLPAGGAISGRITDAGTGNPVPLGSVGVFSSAGKLLASAGANSQGFYTVKGLAAAAGDRVCAFPNKVSASVSYGGQCWKNIIWNGRNLPTGTTPVSVSLGHTHTGISFKVKRTTIGLGSISGTITEAVGHSALQNASVSVFTAGGSPVANVSTGPSGNYTATHLPPSSSGYVVCAKGDSASSSAVSTPPTGWAPRCYVDVAWTGAGLPSSATKVPLSAGQQRAGVNIALHVGGEISGTVFVNGGSTPAPSVQTELYTPGGSLITSTFSGFADGTYSFKDLSPGGYIVCFDGRNDFSMPPGFLPQCYDQVPWSGSSSALRR